LSLRHREHRVGLVPQDDRPVSTKSVRALARLVDYDVSMPPAEMIGRFDVPGDPEALIHWLSSTAPEVDSVLVSIDMLAYGGHVASRQPLVRLETALQRLECLAELRRRNPDQAIYAFATIPPPEGMPLVGRDVGESRAVAADGSFTRLRHAIAEGIHEKGVPKGMAAAVGWIAVRFAGWRLGANLEDSDPARWAGMIAPRALLLIHGGGDPYAATEEVEAMFAAAGDPKELWVVPNAGHRNVDEVEPAAYKEKVIGFFERWLG